MKTRKRKLCMVNGKLHSPSVNYLVTKLERELAKLRDEFDTLEFTSSIATLREITQVNIEMQKARKEKE